jgi:para-nitrobenzyl esterase
MANELVANTSTGKIEGALSDGILSFKGIPYAAPPVGSLRFKPPVRLAAWSGIRATTRFGARAMQNDNAFDIAPAVRALFTAPPREPMSEDCLFINVWTPALDNGGDRPVMVWLHGGGFIAGSGASDWYDGTNLARKGDVVVVTLNHRLGAFGHLYLAEFGDGAYVQSGNVGMLDIVAALEWVRDNATAFGGDPGNVTIFGESGGGAKTCILMAMPAAHGLFHKAIVQSGPSVETMAAAAATDTARQVMQELGVSSVRDLVATPATTLLGAQNSVLARISALSFANRRRQGFNPVIDSVVLPGGPFAPTAPAISADVPLIIGTNKDEMNLFFGMAPWTEHLLEDRLADAARPFLGDRTAAVVAAYRAAEPQASPRDIVLRIATDQAMRMPSLTIADRRVALGAAPTYVYLFTWETMVVEGKLGSCHALEIPFVFDNLDKTRLTGDAPTRGMLVEAMSRAWIEFAYKDNPNHRGIPYWPAYNAIERPTMIFDLQCRVEDDPLGAERRAWDEGREAD